MAISGSLVSFGISVGIFGILAVGMNIKFGYTGLLEIGHVAFYLLGGYMTALLVLPPSSPGQQYILGLGLPWVVAILLASLFAGAIGALVSLPAIRLREDYLAITLLGMAFIVQQLFRSERWLANGPRALAGFERPLNSLFPVPGDTLGSAIVFGVLVVLFWMAATYALARLSEITTVDSGREAVVHGVFALTTLGVGYLFGRRARAGAEDVNTFDVLVASLLVGGIATVVTLVTPDVSNELVALVFVGAFSLFTWAYAYVRIRHYFSKATAFDALYGLGLTTLFFATLAPLVVLGNNQNDTTSAIGMLMTVVFLAVYIYGLVYLSRNWNHYGSDNVDLVSIVGIGAVWLFLVRYFVVSLVTSIQSGGVSTVFLNTFQNLIWLLQFDPNLGIGIEYDRFLFVMVFTSLGLMYYLSETTVNSPFGRVLKAIREDEDVATALGKNTFTYKVQGMAVGSAIAGFAGGLTAIQFQSLTWSIFRIDVTFFVLLMVIIGGTANNRGAILGAVIFWAFSRMTSDLAEFFPTAAGSSIQALRLVIIGALLIVILYYRPEGIWGEKHRTIEVDSE